MPNRRKLLVFNPLPAGGITDYLHFQANALEDQGVSVTMIVCPRFKRRTGTKYILEATLDSPPQGRPSFIRKIRHLTAIVRNVQKLAHYALANDHYHIMLGAFAEYASPLWANTLRKLSRRSRIIGCIIHDPVRDYAVGPEWLHRLSIKLHYEVIDVAFVHHSIDLNMQGARRRPSTVVIPFPYYPFEESKLPWPDIRESLGIPKDDIVLLSFGHIRDDKNIDFVIRALTHHPDTHLIQAGKEQSSGARPAEFYQNLAEQLGVAHRFHLMNRFIEQEELESLFDAADFAVLTYSSNFHSGSAALGTCVNFSKLMLVSAAEGPLLDAISQYDLGLSVLPDSQSAIIEGLSQLKLSPPHPDWEAFRRENNWETNASLIFASMYSTPIKP